MNTGDLKSSGDVTPPPIPDLVFIRTPRGGVPGRLVRVRPRRHALAQRPGVDGRAAARVRTPAGPRLLVGSGFAAGNGRSTALRLYSDKPMNTGDLKSSGDVTPPPIPDLVFIRTPRGGVPGRLVRVRPRRHALAQRPGVDGRAAARVRTPAGPRVLVGSGFAAGNGRSTALRLYSDKPMNTGDLKSSGDVTPPPIPDLVFIRTPVAVSRVAWFGSVRAAMLSRSAPPSMAARLREFVRLLVLAYSSAPDSPPATAGRRPCGCTRISQ